MRFWKIATVKNIEREISIYLKDVSGGEEEEE